MIPGLESWQSIQTAFRLQGSVLEDLSDTRFMREVISVCSVNIPKILSVVYHLSVFITAGNLNMSNGQ